MVEVIADERIKSARKEHWCNACYFVRECLPDLMDDLTLEEKEVVEKAKANGWKIMTGESYLRQRNKMDGCIYTFKAIPEIHAICVKHDLYYE